MASRPHNLLKVKAGIFAVLLPALFVPIYGQRRGKDVFSAVPIASRERLIVRLKQRVEYERTGQWAKLYDLLHEPTVSKEDYLRLNTEESPTDLEIKMVGFTPTDAISMYPNSGIYLIKGCAAKLKKGRIRNVEDIIEAHLVSGEWYFTGFQVANPNKKCVRRREG